MPMIFVMSERGGESARITLQERVRPAELVDTDAAARLIERIGWAIVEAQDAEARHSVLGTPRSFPGSPPERGRVGADSAWAGA